MKESTQNDERSNEEKNLYFFVRFYMHSLTLKITNTKGQGLLWINI